MGLFVREDGHYQGWLAALLCCWIAMNDDESPAERRAFSRRTWRRRGKTCSAGAPATAAAAAPRNTLRHEQPLPLRPMLLNPTASTHAYNMGIAPACTEQDRVHPISARPPSLNPPDRGETALLDRVTLHSRRKSSTTLMGRISISKPTDFRRLEHSERQRMSLVPLQLDPVVLKRQSGPGSDPPFRPMSSTSADDLVDSPRNSSRVSRGTPLERCQQPTPTSPSLAVTPRGLIRETAKDEMPVRPPLSTHSSSSSIRSLRRSTADARTSVGSGSGSSRNSLEKSRLNRKRSGLKGSGQSADMDIDREILELNTIVEERRAEANGPQSPANQHVPAVAPRMPVSARSETLTDIGSAFSRPLTSVAALPDAPDASSQLAADALSPVTPIKSRLSQPFVSMPDPAIEQSGQHHIRRPSSRVTGWLSNIFSTSSATSAGNRDREQFQEPVRQRPVSETSLCTAASDMESHILTSSSPLSKGTHSRSLTAESRLMTPISPPSTVDGMLEPGPESRVEEPWPLLTHRYSQVGLAL